MDIDEAFEVAVRSDFAEDEERSLNGVLNDIITTRASVEEDGVLNLDAVLAIAAHAFQAGRVYQAEIEDVFPVPMDRQMVYQFLQFLSERAS